MSFILFFLFLAKNNQWLLKFAPTARKIHLPGVSTKKIHRLLFGVVPVAIMLMKMKHCKGSALPVEKNQNAKWKTIIKNIGGVSAVTK
jgi:hypothetical protein